MIASNNEDPRFTAEAMCMDITVFVEIFLYLERQGHMLVYTLQEVWGTAKSGPKFKIQDSSFLNCNVSIKLKLKCKKYNQIFSV